MPINVYHSFLYITIAAMRYSFERHFQGERLAEGPCLSMYSRPLEHIESGEGWVDVRNRRPTGCARKILGCGFRNDTNTNINGYNSKI